MRRETLAGLEVVIAGGSDRQGGGEGPVVVLLHGFGAPGDDLVPLWRVLDVPSDVRFVFPAAPHALALGYGDSRAWWMIDMERLQLALMRGELRDLSREVPAGLDEARAAVLELLRALPARLGAGGSDRSPLVLGGFSQGAMLSCDVVASTGPGDLAVAGLVLLSGTLLASELWTAGLPRRRGLPVFQSHGREDPLLAFSMAEALRDTLDTAGLPVEFVSFSGGHELPAPVLARLGAFITRVLTPAERRT